jgi:hypothetical protein
LSGPSKCHIVVILVKKQQHQANFSVVWRGGNLIVWVDSWSNDSQSSHLSLGKKNYRCDVYVGTDMGGNIGGFYL